MIRENDIKQDHVKNRILSLEFSRQEFIDAWQEESFVGAREHDLAKCKQSSCLGCLFFAVSNVSHETLISILDEKYHDKVTE